MRRFFAGASVTLLFAMAVHAQVAVSITATSGTVAIGGDTITCSAITTPVTATLQPNATLSLATEPVVFTSASNATPGTYHSLLSQTFTVNGIAATVTREVDLRVTSTNSGLSHSVTIQTPTTSFSLPQGVVSFSNFYSPFSAASAGVQNFPANTDDWTMIPTATALNTFNIYTDFPMLALGSLSGNLPGGIAPQQVTLTPNLPLLIGYTQFSNFFSAQPTKGLASTTVNQKVNVNSASFNVQNTVSLRNTPSGLCAEDGVLDIAPANTVTADFGVRGKVDVGLQERITAGERGCGNTGIVVIPGNYIAVLLHEVPAPSSASPGTGSTASQTFTFMFTDPRGFQDLDVVNVLINNFLDGRQACYLAYSRPAGQLFLVPDIGGGLNPGLTLGSGSNTNNSQCTVKGATSSVSTGGTTLTLVLDMSFTNSFAGNKVIYTAARDVNGGNSGWQALGTWALPGGAAPSGPWVGGMSPARSNTLSDQIYTFTFTDTKGFQDISVANILINSAIDGRRACYLAFVPATATTGTLYLVDDAGDAGGPYQSTTVPASGFLFTYNTQCSITATGLTVSGSGNTLTLKVPISFNGYAPLGGSPFAGNQVFYLAARSTTQNSDWQASGSITIP